MNAIVVPNKSTNVRAGKSWRPKLQLLALRLATWLPLRLGFERAADLFCTPFPGTRARAAQASLAGAELERVRCGEQTLQAYRFGDPRSQPYVLLSHGWSSFGLRFQAWIAPLRAAGYAVVAFDHLAHGRSTGSQVTLPGFVQAVLVVGAHFGPAAAAIGHSLGGAALVQAAGRGLQVGRLLLVAPAAAGSAALRRFAAALRLGPGAEQGIRQALEHRLGEAMANFDVETVAASLPQPTLVVHDLQDADVPWAEGERYALRMPAARLLSVSGLGHNRIVDAPEVLQAGLGFLVHGTPAGERLQGAGSLDRRAF